MSTSDSSSITKFIDSTSGSIDNYKDLSWRLEVITNTRAIRNIHRPQVVFRLRLSQPDGSEKITFVKSDLGNLYNLKDNIEEACNVFH